MFAILTVRSGQDTDGTKSLTEELSKTGTVYRADRRFRESVAEGEITEGTNSPTLELLEREAGSEETNTRTRLSEKVWPAACVSLSQANEKRRARSCGHVPAVQSKCSGPGAAEQHAPGGGLTNSNECSWF